MKLYFHKSCNFGKILKFLKFMISAKVEFQGKCENIKMVYNFHIILKHFYLGINIFCFTAQVFKIFGKIIIFVMSTILLLFYMRII
jgi:hypothetical protein